jgi:hypothetical protein
MTLSDPFCGNGGGDGGGVMEIELLEFDFNVLKSTCKGVVSSVSITSFLPQSALLRFNSSPTEDSDVADDGMETVEEKGIIDLDVVNVCRGRLALLLRCTLRASHFEGLIFAKFSLIC